MLTDDQGRLWEPSKPAPWASQKPDSNWLPIAALAVWVAILGGAGAFVGRLLF